MVMLEVSNTVRQKDIEEIASASIVAKLCNKTIFITGATGLLGSEMVFALLAANRLFNYNIKVVGLVRNLAKAEKLFANVLNNTNFQIFVQDVTSDINYSEQVDYIVHTASVTSSKAFVEQPTQTILTAINGTKNILDFANEKKATIIYLSSLEAYGNIILKDGEYVNVADPAVHPRTTIGFKEDGTIVLYVVDGRQPTFSVGLTDLACAEYMKSLGCVAAIRMDGGGSSTMGLRMPGDKTITTNFINS